MPINSQKGHCVCSWKKGYKARAPNSNIVFLTLTNKSCFEFGCPGWYLLVKGRFVWGTHQLSKKKIGKFSFAQNSVSVSSLPVALWELSSFLGKHILILHSGVSRGSRGGSGILKKQTPFRTPSDGSGSAQPLRKGVKNFVRLKTLSSTPFFERIPIPPPKSQWGIIL